jgi:charged multivesicular body protein 7
VAGRLTSALVVRPLSWAFKQLSTTEYDSQAKETSEVRWKRVQGDYITLPVLKVVDFLLCPGYRTNASKY